MTDPNTPLDPYASMVEPRVSGKASKFWKPMTPERIIGKLDRVESGGANFADQAVFLDAITYLLPSHKPVRRGEVVLSLGVNLAERILPEDSGRYFVVTFREFGTPVPPNKAPRYFDVAVVPLDREATLRAALAKDAAVVAGNLGGGNDELPF